MKALAIVDLQFGSTGKGNMAAWMGMHGGPNGQHFDAVATNWGPNAGHTAVYVNGEKVVRTMLSNAVHRSKITKVFIGPGSALNIPALLSEIAYTDDAMAAKSDQRQINVYIHANTPVVTEADRKAETVHNRIGSTQKGTAQAWINRMMRDADNHCLASHRREELVSASVIFSHFNIHVCSNEFYLHTLNSCENVLLEGCQGYSLGISSGFWPYVTARECTVAQLCADTLVSPLCLTDVIGTARTYPIRVANRFNEAGSMVGFSGPHYPDQTETTFEDIGQPVEYTTVTKLPRRVFTFSHDQITQAVQANGVTGVFLNFLNYMPNPAEREVFVQKVDRTLARAGTGAFGPLKTFPRVQYRGMGPSIGDIIRTC